MSEQYATRETACGQLGHAHVWTQVRPGYWPYDGQPCQCGEFERRGKELVPRQPEQAPVPAEHKNGPVT